MHTSRVISDVVGFGSGLANYDAQYCRIFCDSASTPMSRVISDVALSPAAQPLKPLSREF